MQECGGAAPDGLSGAFFVLQWEQDFCAGGCPAEGAAAYERTLCDAGPARVHGGTVIRDTLQYKYRSHPKVKRIMPGDNPGVTVLVLREL